MNYSLGKLVEVRKGKSDKGIWSFLNYVQRISSKHITYSIDDAKTEKEFNENLVKRLNEEKIRYQNYANEIEEIALRVKENGFEKIVEYYQNLQSKTEEVGK